MASVFKRGGKRNRGGSYYISWNDHLGKRQTKCAKTTDKATAERIVAKLEADAALRREGVIDPRLDSVNKESGRSLREHLDSFEMKMMAAGRDAEHIRVTVRYIEKIADAEQFYVAGDIHADGVNHYASELKAAGKSARTVQAYLTAIKSFTKWLTSHNKLPTDPLGSVKKPKSSCPLKTKVSCQLVPGNKHVITSRG